MQLELPLLETTTEKPKQQQRLTTAKNTFKKIIYIHIYMCMCAQSLSCVWLWDSMDCSLPCSCSSLHRDSPGTNTGVGCHALLQGIFPIQGSNPGLLQCRRILYHLSHQGSPRILEWVASYPFSRGISWPRNWTGVSCIAGGFFTSWVTREAPYNIFIYK